MAKRASRTAGKARKPERIDGHSLSPQKELSQLLKCRFPEVFVEGKIDGDKLRQSLGEELDTNNERYGLSWAGKAECFRHIQETTTATLKPIRGQSVDFDKTENIFIEGDNLEVLKILQKTYQNKVKMIYIDPPYNTGNDSFIYPDRFKEEKDDYELRAGIKDAEGLLTKDGFWRKNSKDAGHFHSNWLSMMYPRLFLARSLLRKDGVIYISIGQDEISNLIQVCNDIFGEENRISICTRLMKTGGQKGKFFSPNTDYVLVYGKSIDAIDTFQDELSEDLIKTVYTQVQDNGPRKGEKFREMGLFQPTLDIRANQRYYIECPDGTFAIPPGKTFPEDIAGGSKSKPVDGDGVWRWIYERYKKEYLKGNIVFKETEASPLITADKNRCRWNIYTKIWLKDRLEQGKLPLDIFDKFENRHSAQELNKLSIPFDFAKPSDLISYLIGLCGVSDNDIVIDFFAGSCTTAHAVMKLNAKDGRNRKFICVQLAEPCEEESEAYKAGFKTIADIGKERIRRAGKKIKKEMEGNLKFEKNRLDLGFKVFRLEESNFKQWRENIRTGEELKEQMRMFVDNVKKGAGSEDMLFEIILKNSRFDLNVKIEKESFDGVEYYRLTAENAETAEATEATENDIEIICLDSRITKKFVDKVLRDKPERFTCLDIAFKNNDQLKTNTALQMESAKIEFKVI